MRLRKLKRGVRDILKRLFVILIITFSALCFFACQDIKETIEKPIITEDDLLDHSDEDNIVIDQTGFFRRIDPIHFKFAWIFIEGKYNIPSTLTLEEKKVYIKNENQKLFDLSLLETEGHTLSFFVSNVTKMILLSYKTKEDFLSDLENLKLLVPYATVEINLNTIDETVILNSDITEETIDSKLFIYLDYIDERESISFTVINLIKEYPETNDDNYVVFPDSDIRNIILSNYQEYLIYYPSNTMQLSENDFDEHRFLLVYGIKATEEIIKVKAVYVQNQVEIVFEVEALSHLMPSVVNRYVALVKVSKNDVLSQTVLNPVFHTHYQTGYLAQVPFGIR